MKRHNDQPRSRLARRAIGGVMTAAIVGALLPACLDRPLEPLDPRPTSSFTETLTQNRVDKIDILLAIDNSGSMGDKQDILAVAVPDLVNELVNPACVDTKGNFVSKPTDPLADCPADARREFEPITDIHIGIISTSLGARGSTEQCTQAKDDDNANLISRIDTDTSLPTFEDKGFLAWQPTAEGSSAGQYKDLPTLESDLTKMVKGVGQTGCGLEAQMESWYRFLVDPDPYATIEVVDNGNPEAANKAKAMGTDASVLEQRDAFLRPDSLVAIVMLTDENDCSFRPESYGYLVGSSQAMGNLQARSECKEDITDACCAPCGQAPGSCPDDPTCSVPSSDENSRINLTCIQQKQRFGYDFLFPIDRYVKALTEREIQDRHGEVAPNPLLVSKDGILRAKDNVFLTGIVGVPWQLIARNSDDLREGYMSADELHSNGIWDAIVGDVKKGVAPTDPHMQESWLPRTNVPGPGSAPGADPYNGHDYNVNLESAASGDLQYACTFELPTPIDCETGSCDCGAAVDGENPLCQAPDGSYANTQFRAKAYPSLRELAVLKDVGDQAVVSSICPAQLDNNGESDFGYRPAVEALVDRLKDKLKDPCLARSLTPDEETGQVSCLILEGRALTAGESCSCDHALGRRPVDPVNKIAEQEALADPSAVFAGVNCICEIEQLGGDELNACQDQTEEPVATDAGEVNGWCYIDAEVTPPVGDEDLVSHCPATEKRTIRFAGEGRPVNKSLLFLNCHQEN